MVKESPFSGQRVGVLGLGRSGFAALELLQHYGITPSLWDAVSGEAANALRQSMAKYEVLGLKVFLGDDALRHASTEVLDVLVLSPGVDPRSPLVQRFLERKIRLIGELELAWQHHSRPVIAITGTNGKTTTTELITTLAKACGLRALAAGNIGLPYSSVVLNHEAQDDLDWVVLEVSSFQLETVEQFHPRVAVWLNLTPDHLDRYPGMREYGAAKERIFENLTQEDWVVIRSKEQVASGFQQRLEFSSEVAEADFSLTADDRVLFRGEEVFQMQGAVLQGVHNAENVMAALGVAHGLDWPRDVCVAAAMKYRPQPHRGELVGRVNGVSWINDSKATNFDALEKALRSQKDKIVLIAGGKEKGLNFEGLRGLVGEKVKQAFLLGETKHGMQQAWEGACAIELVENLAAAVQRAHEESLKNDVVLFSPGASSYDMYKNFEERGEAFRRLVQALS